VNLLDRLISDKKPSHDGYTSQAEFLFILGMHRSGTSCLAGNLERCGLFLDDVVRDSPHNAKGNHEFRKARYVHSQILHASGGSWHRPPAVIKVNWQQKRALRAIASQLSRHIPCGLKDPRLLLLLDAWIKVVDTYTLIGTFRHPIAVARSLTERNQMPAEEAHNLWLTYNTKLVWWHKIHHFPIIEFDLSDIDAYCHAVATAAITLGLKPDMTRLREFTSPDLNHSLLKDASVPSSCQAVYNYLRRHRMAP
jgi:hypothetical protein